MLPTPPNLTWLDCDFDDLSARHVHSLLKLRQQIFIIEQTCIFPDIDGLDPRCRHIVAYEGDDVLAAARIVAPGIDPDHAEQGDRPAIGRVVTSDRLRGQGIGREVMRRAIEVCEKQFAGKPIYLNGQLYLRGFYESLGFVQFGDEYDEDGIAHISMERPANLK
ncbi:GNAT family N-acetyltransferase [Thalassospira indica]|uniref:GNAT family N-acetyltransferase n=1 Tax=Thalassospira indica TaxID=1891279 RepID=A0ABN5NK88_9PROT|nr:GNAT family N-acetyltransferase [Thalassospira indica]AXO14734.1 GNAT family N-acetyltransferase [Thalassospira indica]OAZ12737.1 acetyltransferase [Thalassospira profundimaris]